MKSQRRRGILLASVGMLIVSTDSPLTRMADTSAFNITFWMGVMTFVVLTGVVIAQGKNPIELMRLGGSPVSTLAVLQAAKAMDVLGNKEARVYVSAVKAMVPEKVCHIIDAAIQMHGATGISQWTPLAEMYMDMRHLRFADGPDEVHHMVVGRAEVQSYGLW